MVWSPRVRRFAATLGFGVEPLRGTSVPSVNVPLFANCQHQTTTAWGHLTEVDSRFLRIQLRRGPDHQREFVTIRI